MLVQYGSDSLYSNFKYRDIENVGLELFTVATMKNAVFWGCGAMWVYYKLMFH
jgi:hypothetical protein